MTQPARTNRLIHETSPYLLQHAQNPVDWYPWSEEALKRARQEDRPILLSIGYSACHWCHVMERESFENEEIAAIMNRHFINIKVDREERPDLDRIYQIAIQLFGQSGGWPLTMFLTPDLEPFYGGTYFPPDSLPDRPGFRGILLKIAEFYRNEKGQIRDTVVKVREAIHKIHQSPKARDGEFSMELFTRAAERLAQQFDSVHGGFGTQPKFPNTPNLGVFLRTAYRTQDKEYLHKAALSLRRMAEGGIYDQLGGGYHRYTVDAQWQIPHFEKMLYDNALITLTNVEALQLTQDPLFERVVRETLDFVLREMTSPEGGFYASQSAESEGGEGLYYVWTPQEIEAVVGPETAKAVCAYYGVTSGGNFEGHTSVLSVCSSPKHVAFDLNVSEADVLPVLEQARRALLEHRQSRPLPFRDEKIITARNALMISACADAAKVLGEERFEAAACRAADFVLRRLCQGSQLLHSIKDGKARAKGFLDDYAFFVAALLDLFMLTQRREYLEQAISLGHATLQQFWDDRHGGFYYTPRAYERLLERIKIVHDDAVPSATAVATQNMLRLFSLTEQVDFREPVAQILRMYAKEMDETPFGFSSLLCAFDSYFHGITEIIIVGSLADDATRQLLRAIHRAYLPSSVVYLMRPGEAVGERVPDLLRGKTQVDGKPTVYVCRNYVCSSPATSWEEIEPLLVQAGAPRARPS